MPVDYSTWTVKLLKQALSERGAKTTGRKAELIERLQAFDRNYNFRGTIVIQLPEVIPMPEWPKISFRTVTDTDLDSMPKVCKTVLNSCLVIRNNKEKRFSLVLVTNSMQ
jgi:hypothetical protein